MTKKDYELIAQALFEVKPNRKVQNNIIFDSKLETWTQCVGSIMVALKADNPAFNSEHFIIACERGLKVHA